MRIYGHKLITCKNGNLDVITLNGILISTLTYDLHASRNVGSCHQLDKILVEWQFFVRTAVSRDVT